MKIYQLVRTQRLPIPVDIAWAFFSNPANLLQLSPPEFGMRDVSLEHPKQVYPGLLQVYRIKILGILSWDWVAEIRSVEEPCAFVDEQKVGPFAYWHHRHEIIEIENGVEVRDTVHYAVPFGWLGMLGHFLLLRRKIEGLFNYRARMLEDFFGQY